MDRTSVAHSVIASEARKLEVLELSNAAGASNLRLVKLRDCDNLFHFNLMSGIFDESGLGRGAAGPDRWCTTTAAGALRVIVYDGSIHMSGHAPPPVLIGNGVTGGPAEDLNRCHCAGWIRGRKN